MAGQWTSLIAPPRLRTGDPSRHATWLELFFDLVFVVAIAEVAHMLHKPLDGDTILKFLLLYVPIYWAWVGHTVYANRFDTDDLPYRLITFGMMVASLLMAVPISGMNDAGLQLYAVGYLCARVLLLVLYLRAHLSLPDARPMTRVYLQGFSLGAVFWVASIFVPPPATYMLWLVGLVIDLLTPWRNRRVLGGYPLHVEHFPERMGLLTIIVLGENIVATEAGLSKVPAEGVWIAAAVGGFLVTACIWWLYFTFVQHAKLDRALRHGLPYVYIHLPLTIGICVMSVAIGHLVQEAASAEPKAGTLNLLGVGATLWLGSFFTLMWRIDRRHMRRNLVFGFILAIAGTLSLCLFGGDLSPIEVIGATLAIFLALVVLDTQYGMPATEIGDNADSSGESPRQAEESEPGPPGPAAGGPAP
jgi:low temperature requirement protein LtrA